MPSQLCTCVCMCMCACVLLIDSAALSPEHLSALMPSMHFLGQIHPLHPNSFSIIIIIIYIKLKQLYKSFILFHSVYAVIEQTQRCVCEVKHVQLTVGLDGSLLYCPAELEASFYGFHFNCKVRCPVSNLFLVFS